MTLDSDSHEYEIFVEDFIELNSLLDEYLYKKAELANYSGEKSYVLGKLIQGARDLLKNNDFVCALTTLFEVHLETFDDDESLKQIETSKVQRKKALIQDILFHVL